MSKRVLTGNVKLDKVGVLTHGEVVEGDEVVLDEEVDPDVDDVGAFSLSAVAGLECQKSRSKEMLLLTIRLTAEQSRTGRLSKSRKLRFSQMSKKIALNSALPLLCKQLLSKFLAA